MIVEALVALVAGVTAVTLGGLWFADKALKREHPSSSLPPRLEELRKSRDKWLSASRDVYVNYDDRGRALAQAKKLDDQIQALLAKGGP